MTTPSTPCRRSGRAAGGNSSSPVSALLSDHSGKSHNQGSRKSWSGPSGTSWVTLYKSTGRRGRAGAGGRRDSGGVRLKASSHGVGHMLLVGGGGGGRGGARRSVHAAVSADRV